MGKRIKVGMVGTGWMGRTLLSRLVAHPDTEVVGLCRRDPAKAAQVLKEFGLDAGLACADYERLLGIEGLQAVVLASPNCYHGPQSIAALKAGKHVFCEKPAATVYDEYTQQIELERASPGLVTFVDYILYFDTFQERLRRMVAEGEFGRVSQIQINYRHPINIEGDKVWKLDGELMGDAIGMGIVHALSAMVYVMQPQAKPVSVFASSSPASERGFERDPVWNIQVGFDNGCTGFCFGNIDVANGYDAYHNVHGSEGGLVFDSGLDRPQKVRYWSNKTTGGKWGYPLDTDRCARDGFEPWPADTTTPDSGNVVEHQTSRCIDHFIECIKTGKRSPLSFANSMAVADIGWAAQMSAGLGERIELPLDRARASAYFANAHAGSAGITGAM
jgi:predicted dehydrogenase